MKKSKVHLVFVIYLLVPFIALADNALERFYDSLGGGVNISKGGAFEDQAARYYTGGGLMLRQRNKSYHPITISPPTVSAGCGGIDAYFGSMSFIKGEQLLELARGLPSQAQTYAFFLGLATMAPQLENQVSKLLKQVMDMNNFTIGDCRMVQQMFASALPKGTAFQEQACIDVIKQGAGEDWFGAKNACAKDDKRIEKVNEYKARNEDAMTGEYNLTWHILKKLKAQEALPETDMEFWLTMVGTIVQRSHGKGYKYRFIAGKAADEETWMTLLTGRGAITIKACADKDKCLDISEAKMEIKEGLKHKIRKRLDDMKDKYLNGVELSIDEKTFINDVSDVPIWTYIQVIAATGHDAFFELILDHIAIQLLLAQLEKIVTDIESHSHELENIQQDPEKVKEFREHLHHLKTQIKMRRGPLSTQQIFQMNRIIEAEEKRVRLMNNLG